MVRPFRFQVSLSLLFTLLLTALVLPAEAQMRGYGRKGMGERPPAEAQESQGDWIDVHFHLMADKGDLESFDEAARAALQVMDAERIRTIVVMSPPRNPAVLKENIGGFERLLAHNRKAKIVWAHAGGDPVGHFTPRLVRELLGRHSNLALSIRPTTGPFPGAMVPPKGAINDDWIAVLRDFPDRFVIGSDNFVVPTRYTGPDAPPHICAARRDAATRHSTAAVPPASGSGAPYRL